jgi:hypothetical protein
MPHPYIIRENTLMRRLKIIAGFLCLFSCALPALAVGQGDWYTVALQLLLHEWEVKLEKM